MISILLHSKIMGLTNLSMGGLTHFCVDKKADQVKSLQVGHFAILERIFELMTEDFT